MATHPCGLRRSLQWNAPTDVNAHSKWPKVIEMAATSDSTITMLRKVCATFRLPKQFTWNDTEFVQSNCVNHIRTAPCHPSFNGAVQQLVQTFKQAIRAREQNGFTLQYQLQIFDTVLEHTSLHNWPVSCLIVPGLPPAHPVWFAMSHRGRERERVSRREQDRQKQHHDTYVCYSEFSVRSWVMVRDGRDRSKWFPRTILERGPVSYWVQTESDLVHPKILDHLREYMLLQAAKTRHNCHSPVHRHYRRVL